MLIWTLELVLRQAPPFGTTQWNGLQLLRDDLVERSQTCCEAGVEVGVESASLQHPASVSSCVVLTFSVVSLVSCLFLEESRVPRKLQPLLVSAEHDGSLFAIAVERQLSLFVRFFQPFVRSGTTLHRIIRAPSAAPRHGVVAHLLDFCDMYHSKRSSVLPTVLPCRLPGQDHVGHLGPERLLLGLS